MCLDSTKQEYVLLTAFKRAGRSGLSLTRLVPEMKRVSRDRFGSERFALKPLPLLSVLQDENELGHYVVDDDGKLIITDEGRSTLQIIEDRFVNPHFPRPQT